LIAKRSAAAMHLLEDLKASCHADRGPVSRSRPQEMSALKSGHIPHLLATEYASYRDDVVKALSSVLADVQTARSRPLVLYDPMAGTAPLLPLAECCGYTAHFNDLNSLHLYVNAAKTLRSYLAFKRMGATTLLSMLCRMSAQLDRCPRIPTERWMDDATLRVLARAWHKCGEKSKPIAILTKALLLLAVRDFSSRIGTKNPTWLKPGGLRPSISVREAFQSAVNRLATFYEQTYVLHEVSKRGQVFLTDRDASRYTPKRQVDVIVTSPPFCNRVDWDRLYAPEHFFLDAVGVWHTRADFLGTTAVRDYDGFASDLVFATTRSSHVKRLLKKVKDRQIYAERGSDYYVKYFTRYFSGLFRAFDVAASSLHSKTGEIYFVVQDNRHRGLQIDIGRALAQSLSCRGFHARVLRSWERHHLGMRNVSRRHRAVTPRQRESLWHASR